MTLLAVHPEPSRTLVRPLTGRTSVLLCTVAAVQAQPGCSAAVTADVEALIELAGDVFATEEGLGRPFWLQRWSANLSGDGGQFLVVPRWPIVRVVSLTTGVDNPTTIDAADYAVRSSGDRGGPLGSRDVLFRTDGWEFTPIPGGMRTVADREMPYAIDCWAGWLMPGEVVAWSAGAKALGAWVRPAAAQASLFLFECTTAGTVGGAEPTWPTTEGEAVTDGSVVWTARAASTVPTVVQRAAVLQVAEWYRGGQLGIPTGIRREKHGETEVWYQEDGASRELPPLSPVVAGMLRAYR
jgi:hypothetical protein